MGNTEVWPNLFRQMLLCSDLKLDFLMKGLNTNVLGLHTNLALRLSSLCTFFNLFSRNTWLEFIH